jgi:hypothetical protein
VCAPGSHLGACVFLFFYFCFVLLTLLRPSYFASRCFRGLRFLRERVGIAWPPSLFGIRGLAPLIFPPDVAVAVIGVRAYFLSDGAVC